MPFQIVRNDITKVKADVIVNTANPKPAVGSGTDSAIYHAAGEEQLLAERKKIGDIAPGNVAATPAFKLSAKFIIHTVGPAWIDGNHGERDILHSCYAKSLSLAKDLKAKSIAFPLIATGVYGFPKDEALNIALAEIGSFLLTHDMNVTLVVFDRKSFQLSSQLISEIEEYIDEHGVGLARVEEYGGGDADDVRRRMDMQRRQKDSSLWDFDLSTLQSLHVVESEPYVSAIDVKGKTLEEVLGKTGKTFQQKLFELIDERGLKDSTVYRNSNIDKSVFSSIRCKKNYMPKKNTVLALSVGLKLDMPDMVDLLGRAGYALSPSNKSDLIVSYYVENKKYNIFEINAVLDNYGFEILGSVAREAKRA